MTPIQATTELAHELMTLHGLNDWYFHLDNAKRRAGQCSYRRKRISLSIPYIVRNFHINPDDIKDTILHEIAHAIVGPNHGHDQVWKHACRQIGAKPKRCTEQHIIFQKGKYQATCPRCNLTFTRHRKPKTRRYCRCCPIIPEVNHLRWLENNPIAIPANVASQSAPTQTPTQKVCPVCHKTVFHKAFACLCGYDFNKRKLS